MPAAPNQTRPTNASVEAFLNGFAGDRKRADAFTLLALMHQVTQQPPQMWGPAIVGFGQYHYIYPSGREGDSPLLAFSPRAANLTLYGPDNWPRYQALLDQLGKHTLSQYCLHIKRLSDIHTPTLQQLIQAAYHDAQAAAPGPHYSH